MEIVQEIDPMTWIIIIAALIISVAVLFNKAIKFMLKLAAIAVCAAFVIFFLIQANVIPPPPFLGDK